MINEKPIQSYNSYVKNGLHMYYQIFDFDT